MVPPVDLGYPLASDCVLGRMLFVLRLRLDSSRLSTITARISSRRRPRAPRPSVPPIRLPYAQLLPAITSTSDPPTTPSSPANRSVASSCLRYSACKSLPPPSNQLCYLRVHILRAAIFLSFLAPFFNESCPSRGRRYLPRRT
ncbi:hypothetical protein K523DRAFT_76188 [Schizophyllum commune Tattone D]|nr:hypothetical protein K523DRAFT_76188 [Schizophyllum commune Tattone D]